MCYVKKSTEAKAKKETTLAKNELVTIQAFHWPWHMTLAGNVSSIFYSIKYEVSKSIALFSRQLIVTHINTLNTKKIQKHFFYTYAP